jgi:putative DNA primase/helicase
MPDPNVGVGANGDGHASAADIQAPQTKPFSTSDHAGQVRLSHFLARYFDGHLIHVKNTPTGWFYWTGTHWQEDDIGRSIEAVKATLKRAAIRAVNLQATDPQRADKLLADVKKCWSTASGVAGVLKMAESNPVFARSIHKLDADPYLLNMPNGTLDLRTFKVKEHDPADLMTRITHGRYFGDHRDQIGPVWNAHLDRILPKRVRRYLLRVFGKGALIGTLPEPNMLAVLHGPKGRNGKSKTYEAIITALGGLNGDGYQANSELLLEQKGSTHPTRLFSLRGRRFVVTAEINEGRRLNAALMKELTGNQFINARAMHKNEIQMPVTWLLVMVTNNLPQVDSNDMGVWKRMKTVPFLVELAEKDQDERLAEKLATQREADGVLVSLVEGYKDAIRNGLEEPEEVHTATKRYRLSNNKAGRFIDERCLVGAEALAAAEDGGAHYPTSTELLDAYIKWFYGEHPGTAAMPLGPKQFSQALKALGFERRQGLPDKAWRWGSLVLRPEDEDA